MNGLRFTALAVLAGLGSGGCTSSLVRVGRVQTSTVGGPLDGSWDGDVSCGDGPVGRLGMDLNAESTGFYAGAGEVADPTDHVWTSFAVTVADPYAPVALDIDPLKVSLTDCRDQDAAPAPCVRMTDVQWTPAASTVTGELPDFRDLGDCGFELAP